MLNQKLIIFLTISFFTRLTNGVSYDGYKTHMILPTTRRQKEALGSLMTAPGIDFWAPPNGLRPTIMTSPQSTDFFYNFMKYYKIPFNTTVHNVAEIIHREKQLQNLMSRKNMRSSESSYLTKYLRYKEIVKVLKRMVRNNKGKCKLVIIGKTAEGRPIYMLKISDDFSQKKGVVMLEAGIHAREWAAPAMALHLMHKVVRSPRLLTSVEWHIIPSANPDGYEFSHTKDRMWRKTRSHNSKESNCIGADGNRNFDIHWGEIGGSTDPCSLIFHGTGPFSEKEAQAMKRAATDVKERLKVYLAVHSYGSFILYPMGHSKELLPDWKDLDVCGKEARDTIIEEGGPSFTVGNTATVLYPSGGGSDDYAKAVLGAQYAYTIELPGGGDYGFDLPPTEISAVVNQVFPGIVHLAHCWVNK